MELLKQQLPFTDMIGVWFIWCLRFTEIGLAERRLMCCTQLKVSSISYLVLLTKCQKLLHFRNVHSLWLMNMLHETKTISLARDFKGLRPSVEWKYTYGKNDWNSMPKLLQRLFSVLLLLNVTILVALYQSPWGISSIVYIVLVLTLH